MWIVGAQPGLKVSIRCASKQRGRNRGRETHRAGGKRESGEETSKNLTLTPCMSWRRSAPPPLLCRTDHTLFRHSLSSKQPQITNKMTTTTTIGLQDRTRALLDSLESSGILLVEWETSLFVRLGYPLVSNGVSHNPLYSPVQITTTYNHLANMSITEHLSSCPRHPVTTSPLSRRQRGPLPGKREHPYLRLPLRVVSSRPAFPARRLNNTKIWPEP